MKSDICGPRHHQSIPISQNRYLDHSILARLKWAASQTFVLCCLYHYHPETKTVCNKHECNYQIWIINPCIEATQVARLNKVTKN